MSKPQTIILVGDSQRQYAHQCIDEAPPGYFVHIKEPTRSLVQNARLWAILGDISKAEPLGKKLVPDDWKSVFMKAMQYETRFVMDLNGKHFPVGFRSHKLTIKQMSDLMEYMTCFCAEHGVELSEPLEVEK